DRVLEHVIAAVDAPRFLAFGERGAVAGGRVEGANTGPRGTDALGQVALRHELELDVPVVVEPVEYPGIDLPRKRTDDLLHLSRLEQCREAGIAVTGVVVNDGKPRHAVGNQR